ncbi:uncharacterized protein LOC129592274 [Paramacrobiotus metropolitanus]|uniref:uncharacterized protein LOC129592274 n=1 Tax=Paramacrobiotus metropolitanus TaxID=2943436 RepID=UPI00244628C9|nr:uncharacterized protein LOC129592274 [Paramacrobiotus metropolitanus]XP_055344243.1 uncharacterized protein LOC129592274 [Paramacrobiotus metropolitanus]
MPEKQTTSINTRHLTQEEKLEIVDLFDKGCSCVHIMRKFSVSRHFIKRVLIAAGRTVIFTEQDRQRYDALRPVVLRLFRQGWSFQMIAQRFKTSLLWVEMIVRAAGLTPETPPGRSVSVNGVPASSSQLKFKWPNIIDIITIDEEDSAGQTPYTPKTNDPCTVPQLNPTADGGHISNSEISSPADNNKMLCGNQPYKYKCPTTENVELCHDINGIIAKDPSSPENVKEMRALGAAPERESAAESLSTGAVIQWVQMVEHPCASPDTFVETATEVSLLPPNSATVIGRSARYQCEICCFSSDEGEAFLLHLADKEHEQFCATGIFLHCTGCPFKTRKPATMGRHIITYQSQSAIYMYMQNVNMHSVRIYKVET